MPTFEFTLDGPPLSLNVRNHNLPRYRRWVKEVQSTATLAWPATSPPIKSEVAVDITNYYTAPPPDVDNIAKPILDGLKGVVMEDDAQVHTVCIRRVSAMQALILEDAPPSVIKGLAKPIELIHVYLRWDG
jgi:Holliday junction resolvase RusA-like endonuclease